MILVYAGRRTDPDDPTAPPRFPLASAGRVQREIARVLAEERPAAVVGSAACGSDLLVLETAAQLGIRRSVVLPFDRASFRATSVTDRPGEWGPRFDAVMDEVSARGDVLDLGLDPDDPRTYARANVAIYRQALAIAGKPDEDFMALVLWNGETRGAGDVTEGFLHEARHRGWPTTEIDTLNATRVVHRP